MNQRRETHAPWSRLSFPWKTSGFHPLDLRHETNSLDLPRSIDHSRPRQPFNDPCRISANYNTERFQVQCSSSRLSVWNQIETDRSILVVPVESACCLGKLWKNWSILRLFSREKIIIIKIFEYTFERFALEERYMNVICSIFERF